MWRYLTAAVFALTTFTPAEGAEWWWIGSTDQRPDRRLYFIDKSGFTSDYSGSRSAWEFEVYESLQKDGTRKQKALYKFDCKNRTMTLIEFVKFGNNGRLIDAFTLASYEQRDENIVPDSIGEEKWQFVCEGKTELTDPLKNTPEEFSAFYFRTFK